MALLGSPRPWFVLGGLLLVVGMLFVGGAAGGVILAVAAILLLVGIFLSLRKDKPDERVSRAGIIGGL